MNPDLDFVIEPVRRQLPQHRPDPVDTVFETGDDLTLHVVDSVLTGLARHAADRSHEEVGGVLYGRHYETAGRYLVVISEYLPVPSQNASALHFDFDLSSIGAIFAEHDNGRNDYLVGWYHSHVDGQPFMSQLDRQLHQQQFTEPWYVSAVIAAGEGGTPAGFWRMVDGALRSIDGYHVVMSPPGSAAERHQRFVRAYHGDGSGPGAETAQSVLPLLGIGKEHALATGVQAAADLERDRLDGFASLRLLLDAGAALAQHPDGVAEIADLRHRLDRIVSFQDAFVPAVRMAELGDTVAVRGTFCYAMRADRRWLQAIDLRQGPRWRIKLPAGARYAQATEDGNLWIMTDDQHLMRLYANLGHEPEEPSCQMMHLPLLNPGTVEFLVAGRHLFFRSGTHWSAIDMVRDGLGVMNLGAVYETKLPPGSCVLVQPTGLWGDPEAQLVSHHHDVLQLWNLAEDGAVLVTAHELPTPWQGWRLRDAVSDRHGLWVLFDDGRLGQLVRFDRGSLAIDRQYVRGRGTPGRAALTRLCGDGSDTVYARIGGILYRIRP